MRHAPFWLTTTAPARDTVAAAERALMLAALADSIRTILDNGHGRGSITWRREEIGWLLSEDRSRPFTFENICDALGLDPSYLRRRILTAARDLPSRPLHGDIR